MHGTMCTHHASAENAPNTLVSEANTENRDVAGEHTDDGRGNPGLGWSAGARRDDHCARPEPTKIADADRIVSYHFRRFSKLAEIAGYVEDEGIVVVDDRNHDAPAFPARNASKMRCALASVSSYSAAGSDIAVIPPPA